MSNLYESLPQTETADVSYIVERNLETKHEDQTATTSRHDRSALYCLKRVGFALLPSPFTQKYNSKTRRRTSYKTTSYLSGIRGVAAVVVFAEHFLMKYHPRMLDEYGDHPHFFQLPGVRLLYSGQVSVALFFVISGFSLSLQPLQAIHDKDWERLHMTISSSTLRRGIRLILPPAIVTFVVMLGVRFYLVAEHYEGGSDMTLRGPIRQATFWGQLLDWIEYVVGKLIYPDTWLSSLPNITDSDYAEPLYTVSQELWSSLILFVIIIGLSRTKQLARLMSVVFLIILSAWCGRREVSCFLAGMMFAELHLLRHEKKGTSPSASQNVRSHGLWTVVLGIGIWLASVPHTHGSYGSSSLGYHYISKIIPWNSNMYYLGAGIMIFAVDRMPLIQALFSTSVAQYLGDISFGLYLVHWPILAAFGWDVVPFMWKLTGSSTTLTYEVGFWLAILPVAPLVIWMADICWRFVDLKAIQFAEDFENQVLIE